MTRLEKFYRNTITWDEFKKDLEVISSKIYKNEPITLKRMFVILQSYYRCGKQIDGDDMVKHEVGLDCCYKDVLGPEKPDNVISFEQPEKEYVLTPQGEGISFVSIKDITEKNIGD